jgi:hypothetical protein
MAARSSSGSPRHPCPMSTTRCSCAIVSASTPEHPHFLSEAHDLPVLQGSIAPVPETDGRQEGGEDRNHRQ